MKNKILKAVKMYRIFSFALLLVTISSSFAQAPEPDSGRDAANFIPMRERVQIMQKFWDLEKRERTPDDYAGTRGGHMDHQER